MAGKNGDILEFTFQPIKLDDLQKILPVSKTGKYDLIKTQIIERLEKLPPGESFIFAPAKNGASLDAGQIKSFSNSINAAFRGQALPWHCVFSLKAKAFAIAPYARKGHKKNASRAVVSGVAVAALDKLVAATTKTFGVTLKDLQQVPRHGQTRIPGIVDTKRALAYVGKHKLAMRNAAIGRLLGLSGPVIFRYQKESMKSHAVKEKIKLLLAALKKAEVSK